MRTPWACNALDSMGREYRMAYTSPSLSALMAVVSAGLAVTAQLQSLIPPEMRILGEAEGLSAHARSVAMRLNKR